MVEKGNDFMSVENTLTYTLEQRRLHVPEHLPVYCLAGPIAIM